MPTRLGFLYAPFFAVLALWIAGRLGMGGEFIELAQAVWRWGAQTFSFFFLIGALAALAMALFAALMQSDIRIGGPDAGRSVGRFDAVAIGFAASTSVGLLFWSAAEPLYHVHEVISGLDHAPRSRDAQIVARSATLLHWGVLAPAIYAVFFIAFSLSVQTAGRSTSLAGAMFIGDAKGRHGSSGLMDGFSILFPTLLFIGGLAGAVRLISAYAVVGPEASVIAPSILAAVTAIVMLFILIAGARPPSTSFMFLARFSMTVLLMLLLAVIILGPAKEIVLGGFRALLGAVRHGAKLLSNGFASGGDGWAMKWTVTQITSWVIFAPLVGLFLSRAARGYRLGEAVFLFVVWPALIVTLCVLVFGGLSLTVDQVNEGRLYLLVHTHEADEAIRASLAALKFGNGMLALLYLLIALNVISFGAALLHATMRYVAPGKDDDRAVIASRRLAVLSWVILGGFATWAAAGFGLSAPIEALGRVGALPALLVLLMTVIALARIAVMPNKAFQPRKPDPNPEPEVLPPEIDPDARLTRYARIDDRGGSKGS